MLITRVVSKIGKGCDIIPFLHNLTEKVEMTVYTHTVSVSIAVLCMGSWKHEHGGFIRVNGIQVDIYMICGRCCVSGLCGINNCTYETSLHISTEGYTNKCYTIEKQYHSY